MLEPRGALFSTLWVRHQQQPSSPHDGALVVEDGETRVALHSAEDDTLYPLLEYEPLLLGPPLADSVTRTTAIDDSTTDPSTTTLWNSTRFPTMAAVLGLILSGVGAVVAAKLQAVPLRNYPLCSNLVATALYVPLCVAYLSSSSLSSSSRSGCTQNQNQQRSRSSSSTTTATRRESATAPSFVLPPVHHLQQFALIGALDCLVTTVHTFAAAYVEGPLLVLLPQAAIPVSLALTYYSISTTQYRCNGNSSAMMTASSVQNQSLRHARRRWPHTIGAVTVLVGVVGVLWPVLWQHVPSSSQDTAYACGLPPHVASDQDDACHQCHAARTQEECGVAAEDVAAMRRRHAREQRDEQQHGSGRDDQDPEHSRNTLPPSWSRNSVEAEEGMRFSDALWLDFLAKDENVDDSKGNTMEPIDDSSDTDAACLWLPYEESSHDEPLLELIWSLLLVLSTVPMALSALYKQRALQSLSMDTAAAAAAAEEYAANDTIQVDELSPHERTSNGHTNDASLSAPAVYVSGWIAGFQFLASLLVALPAGLIASPTIWPRHLGSNVWDGLACAVGLGRTTTGCHADATTCFEHSGVLWMFVAVGCQVVYTACCVLVLRGDELARSSADAYANNLKNLRNDKCATNSDEGRCISRRQSHDNGVTLLFMAMTAIVPLGHLAFALPILPDESRVPLRASDLAGLAVIVVGLIVYRFASVDFFDRQIAWMRSFRFSSCSSIGVEHSDGMDHSTWDSSCSLLAASLATWPVANQTSYTLLCEESSPSYNSNDPQVPSPMSATPSVRTGDV